VRDVGQVAAGAAVVDLAAGCVPADRAMDSSAVVVPSDQVPGTAGKMSATGAKMFVTGARMSGIALKIAGTPGMTAGFATGLRISATGGKIFVTGERMYAIGARITGTNTTMTESVTNTAKARDRAEKTGQSVVKRCRNVSSR